MFDGSLSWMVQSFMGTSLSPGEPLPPCIGVKNNLVPRGVKEKRQKSRVRNNAPNLQSPDHGASPSCPPRVWNR
jgi:hypothetical protein